MPDDFILSAKGLSKEFLGFLAVDGIELNVRRGQTHALIGPNGAGKTTVFNMLTKVFAPTTGTITFNGDDITGLTAPQVARRGIVRSFQISAVFANQTVLDNLRVALQRRLCVSYHFWKSDKVLRQLDARAHELLEAVGISEHAGRKAGELSYGRKRALEIATTLALDPELLLLDEPMAGLGQEDIGRISELIRKVAQDRTIVMVEHNLSVVADLSDFITVLARGQILAEGVYADVSRHPAVVAAYMGAGHG